MSAATCSTVADTMPSPDAPGGSWLVMCTCGWENTGKYARDGGEAVALRLANLLGTNHENGVGR